MWRPKRILVGTDFSESAKHAAAVAISLARRAHAEVNLVHSAEGRGRWVTGYSVVDELVVPSRPMAEERTELMRRLEDLARELGPPEPKLHVLFGDPTAELHALRKELGCDLIVLGAQGLRGFRRFLLGSVSDRALRRPGPPLLLVRSATRGGEFKRLLVCVENPEERPAALDPAVALAHDLRAEIVLLHVLPPAGYVSDHQHVDLYPEKAQGRLERMIAERDASIPMRVVIERGDPIQLIPRVARDVAADLVVMGAERHADGWPGRVTDRVARAGLPALLVVWPESR